MRGGGDEELWSSGCRWSLVLVVPGAAGPPSPCGTSGEMLIVKKLFLAMYIIKGGKC